VLYLRLLGIANFSMDEIMRKIVIMLLLCNFWTGAQETKPADANSKPAGSTTSTTEQKLTAESDALISQEKIYSGSRVYVAPMVNGFDNYIVAGLQQKKVPVIVVADRSKADYEITGVAETDKAGWAKMLFMGTDQTNETASVKMVNLKTGNIVFAYSVKKGNSVRGKQSAGEACAKHIKQKIVE
jgi:hypothetical protein